MRKLRPSQSPPEGRRGISLILCAIALALACDRAREKLLSGLQSPQPLERAAALKKLGEQSRAEDLVLFLRAAKDPAAPVRARAAEVLGITRDPRVADTLWDLLLDADEAVQGKAAMALGELRTEKAQAYLLRQYGRTGRSTRHAIIQALRIASVQDPMAKAVAAEAKSLWDRSLRASSEGALAEQAAAAEELGKSGRSEAVDRLLDLVRESEIPLAASAARGLGEAGERRAAAALTALLQESSPELRQAACEALGRLQASEALLQLERVANEKSAVSAAATAAVLSLPQTAETNRALCEVALGGSPAEAHAAGREMRRRGGCPLAPIQSHLGKGSVRERGGTSAALLALEALGPTARAALPQVLPLLQDFRPAIRAQAVLVVAEIGDPAAGPALRNLYQNEVQSLEALRAHWIPGPLPMSYAPGFAPRSDGADPQGAEALARTKAEKLWRATNPRALDTADKPPVELVEDVPAEQLRLFSGLLRGLGAVRAPMAQNALTESTRDSSPTIRAGAYAGLALLGGEAATLARAGLADPELKVRRAATLALAEQGEEGQRALLERLQSPDGDARLYLEALSRVEIQARQVEPLRNLVLRGGADSALAAQLLANLRDRQSAAVLIRQLEGSGSDARREILLALGRLAERGAAEVVARDLYHDSADIRAAAALALAELGGPAQRESLLALKGDYYRRVREAAATAVSKLFPGSEADRINGTE